MNFDEFSEQERETKCWLLDLDNFGKPPPPRFLPGLTSPGPYRPRSVMGTETYSEQNDEQHSPIGGYLSDFDPSIYDVDPSDFVNNAQFMQKVRKFQQSNSHPYASKKRVETTKKIGEEGGTKGSAGLLMEKPAQTAKQQPQSPKQKITKAEVAALTDSVRKTNRPTNPWADKEQPAEKNYVLPETANVTHIDTGTFDTRSIGTASSSAYSSFSSVGGQSNASFDIPSAPVRTSFPDSVMKRKASESHSTDSNLTIVENHIPAFNQPLKIETIQSKSNGNVEQKQSSSILKEKNLKENEPGTYQNLPGPKDLSSRTLRPAASPVESDPDYIKLFDDFETDLEKFSRRSRSKTPETNSHYPPPCDPPIVNRAKQNGFSSSRSSDLHHAHPVRSLGSRQSSLNEPPESNGIKRIAIPPDGVTSGNSSMLSSPYKVSALPYSSRSTPSRPTYLQHQYRQLSSGASSGFTSPASSTMPSPNPNMFSPNPNTFSPNSTHSGQSFNSNSGYTKNPPPVYSPHPVETVRKRDIIVDRIPPGESSIPTPVVLRRNNVAMYNKAQVNRNSRNLGNQQTPNVNQNPGPFISKFARGDGKTARHQDPKRTPLSTRSQSDYCLGKNVPTNATSAERGRPLTKVNTRNVPITSSPLPWRNRTNSSGSTNKSASSEALQSQQRKYEELQDQVVQQMEKSQPVYGQNITLAAYHL